MLLGHDGRRREGCCGAILLAEKSHPRCGTEWVGEVGACRSSSTPWYHAVDHTVGHVVCFFRVYRQTFCIGYEKTQNHREPKKEGMTSLPKTPEWPPLCTPACSTPIIVSEDTIESPTNKNCLRHPIKTPENNKGKRAEHIDEALYHSERSGGLRKLWTRGC